MKKINTTSTVRGMKAEQRRKRGGLKERKKPVIIKEALIVSLSLGAPVHCPVVSVRPEPDPPRRRPAAANTESSSSQHPESLYLPLLTVLFLNLKLQVEKKNTVKTITGLYKKVGRCARLVCSD